MNCLVCESSAVRAVSTLTSAFLSKRAWSGLPELTYLCECRSCDFRWFTRRLTAAEATNYYRGYRDASYERERSKCEWFYTKSLHAAVGEWSSSDRRAAHIQGALASLGLTAFPTALDYGGGQSAMLRDLETGHALNYDVDGKPCTAPDGSCALVVCAHVLEHCSDPVAEMERIVKLLAPEGVLYLELPDQHWRDSFEFSLWRLIFIAIACEFPFWFKVLDFLFTGVRVTFRWLPSFAFNPEREHLSYFSPKSMQKLVEGTGLAVLAAGLAPPSKDGPSMYVIARKGAAWR